MFSASDAVCTVVSRNYMHFARVLMGSIRAQHPELRSFVLVVDEYPGGEQFAEDFTVIPVVDLQIPDFRSIAFKYDILELNTGVKPTFFQHLMEHYGIQRLLYFDPDIFIYSSLAPLFEQLREHEILLTPHTLKPVHDGMRPDERDSLRTGVFNLGFVGLAKGSECDAFLQWWEDRCLNLGFNDAGNGYFVDQKWTNFVPCYFNKVDIVKDPGCNVAYWNLHERRIATKGDRHYVEPGSPLTFFHFSGIGIDDAMGVSKHTTRSTLENRPDLAELFRDYRDALRQARGSRSAPKYSWGHFSDGKSINKLCRTVYSLDPKQFGSGDPFDAKGSFYEYAKAMGLLSNAESAAKYTTVSTDFGDRRLKLIHSSFRMVLKVFGADRYMLLCKYLAYVSILRNQAHIFPGPRAASGTSSAKSSIPVSSEQPRTV